MSDMIHFEKWSLDRGHIRVSLDLSKYSKWLEDAQWWLGEQVLAGCKPFMPLDSGSLQDRSHVEEGGRRVVFPGPYARYLYMGFVMVDRETKRGAIPIRDGPNSYVFRFREGAKLEPTNRRLTYSRPEAVSHWFDEAKARNLPHWVRGVENILKTGRP